MDSAKIEAFLASKGVTKCPPRIAKGGHTKQLCHKVFRRAINEFENNA